MEKKTIEMVNMPPKRVESILHTDYLIIEKNTIKARPKRFPHTHEFYELEMVISGMIESGINNTLSRAVKGDFWLSLPNDIHTIFPLCEETVLISVKFTDKLLMRDMRDYLNTFQKSLFGTLPEADFERCKEMFPALIENYRKINSTFNGDVYAKSALEMMLSYFMSYCTDVSNETDKKMLGSSRIFDAVDYIKKNFRKSITINDISERFNYTPNYFSSKFKRVIGCNVIDFINNERLRHAYYLLNTSEMTVSEIAYFVGFDSLSYFSKLFKRSYGVSPTSVKKQSHSICP